MSWRDSAACKGMSQTIFFPPNRVWDEKHCATARRICAACPVKEPCLAEALKVTTNDDGIFAGTTPRERNRLRAGKHVEKRCVICERVYVVLARTTKSRTCSEACSHELSLRRRRRYTAKQRASRDVGGRRVAA